MRHSKKFECGTYSGYQSHYRKGETACAPCKKAASLYAREWQKRNPEKFREYRRTNVQRKAAKQRQRSRRRARLKGNRYENYTLEQVLELYGTKCHICGEEIDMKAPRLCGVKGWERGLHLDHVIDIQFGGADALDNVKPAHALCNLRKNARRGPHSN